VFAISSAEGCDNLETGGLVDDQASFGTVGVGFGIVADAGRGDRGGAGPPDVRRDGVCGSVETHLSIFAGAGVAGVAGAPTPGLATNSALYHPRGPAVDPTTGDVYIADYRNGEVERITPNGILSIVAGTGTFAPPTPGPATKSALAGPTGVAVDATTGDVYIADPYNYEVEKVTRQGILSTVAGTGTAGPPTPGPATKSKLNEPYGVAVDASTGDLYIADYDNSVVEKVTPQGTLSIVAGTGTTGAPTPAPAAQSHLGFPHGVGIDPTTGDLYIADY
jgi:DNA-binding beta-propeller fold protein YncE